MCTSALRKERQTCNLMATQEDLCKDCQRVLKKFRTLCIQPNAFIVHLDVTIIRGKQKRQEKRNRLNKLGKIVSALRNSEGGSVLVHLWGHVIGDQYLGYFDELVSESFTYLIEDGKLYVDTYKRFWLYILSEFVAEQDFVCVSVSKTNGLSTVDFNTKIRNDFENIKPTPLNILSSLVSLSPVEQTSRPVIRGIDSQLLQESRNVEFKSISRCEIEITNIPALIDFIWVTLKLRENVTSMSKISDGGSFYVGIAENNDKSKQYDSKTVGLEGFELFAEYGEYIRHLQTKLKSDISVLKNDGTFDDAPDDLIAVRFHEVKDSSPKRCILEISVRYYDGIVFYDKKGPRAYKILDGAIRRMSRTEWLERIPLEYLVCPLLLV